MTQIKPLEKTIKRRGILYTRLNRSAKFALWELTLGGIIVGYEVSEIRINPKQEKFEHLFPARESLPSDSIFGIYDKSKSFFPTDFDRANAYFIKLSEISN